MPTKLEEVKLYYPNGQLKHIAHYVKGHLEGPAVFYSDQGIILSETSYAADQLHGSIKFYYLNGALFSKQHYERGKWDGIQEFYNSEGELKTRLIYSNGQLQKAELS